MPLDPTLLTAAREAEASVAERERALAEARTEYHVAVKRLHVGASLREIAEALGLSHQRVHQMVNGVGAAWPHLFGLLSDTLRRSRLKCSFCRKPARDLRNLIAGPRVHICDHCVALGRRVVKGHRDAADGRRALALIDSAARQRCSFCGKLGKGDRRIVSGAGARICGDCLDYCDDIVREEGVAS